MTTNEIMELDHIICQLNSLSDNIEKKKYLEMNVEDVDLFLTTLNKINKNSLKQIASRKTSKQAVTCNYSYEKNDVIKFFEHNSLNNILEQTSKAELTAMFYTIYRTKPLSSANKLQIAQKLKGYVQDQARTQALLFS